MFTLPSAPSPATTEVDADTPVYEVEAASARLVPPVG